MLRLARLSIAAGTLAFLFACTRDTAAPPIGGPSFAVSDGAHDGNPDFFFLPPLFKSPNSDPDFEPTAFNARLRPAVEICELGAPAADNTRECVRLIKRFAPGTVNVTDQQYQVNWNTTESALDVTKFYRIQVLVGTTVLGFTDVDPVSSGKDLKSVATGEYIGLVDGRTLPIKFRIESGALCAVDGTDCTAATINLAQGGTVVLEAQGEVFKFDIRPGTVATYGRQVITDITFNLEVCSGIAVDLPKFGQCLRVATFFETSGSAGSELLFSNPALVSMCVLEPGLPQSQENFITLHQQDGTLIRALPHATPNCQVIGARTQEPEGLAARGWRWLRDIAGNLFTPRPLYARSRTALFNLGGGGETNLLGATCTPPPASARQMLMVTCPAAVAPQLLAAATVAAARTISDFQFALPAKMDYVNPADASRSAPTGTSLPTAVKVTDWANAPVQGATVTFTEPGIESPGTVIGTATSDASGIAQISWTIAAGPNNVIASGRGIAAQNNYPDATVKPFMPDISFPTAQQTAVVLRTGAVPFSATGTLVGSLEFIQQPTNTVSGDAISPAIQIRVLDPSGAPISGFARVTVGNDPSNPASCQVLQVSALAIEGVATLSNVIVNGTCTGARLAATAGGGEFEYPVIFSTPFDILPEPAIGLDQQNLLDGSIGGQGIGRFSDVDGTPDPDGTSYDFHDAQTFTVGVSGRLAQIKVPLVNNSEATVGVTMQIVAVVDGVPDEGHSLGEVTIPATAIPTDHAGTIRNPAAWASFDLTSLNIEVVRGQVLAFIVRSLSTSAYIYNPESSSGYANGIGYRRNRALTATWGTFGQDFGFQTFVDRGP